jgi:hypothetical protein
MPCLWNPAYEASLPLGENPAGFARRLIPPRDWPLDRTNALVNRLAGIDNPAKRVADAEEQGAPDRRHPREDSCSSSVN